MPYRIDTEMSDSYQIIGHNRIDIAETTSTNTLLSQMDQLAPLPDGTVLFAGHQTAGKGQFAKSWFSEPNTNILCSILLKPADFPVQSLFDVNIAITLGIFAVLDQHFPGCVKIKWSNDILVHEKKIAGILIENQIGSQKLSRSVVGIGLNVNQIHFPENLHQATSIRMLTQQEAALSYWQHATLKSINYFYVRMLQGFSPIDKKIYISHLIGLHEWRQWRIADGAFTGMITGVDAQGRLMMKGLDQSLHLWNPGEITII